MRKSTMHPGWYCFLCALGSGFFMGIALCTAAVHAFDTHSLGVGLKAAALPLLFSTILFFLGGTKAEKLHERDS